MILGYVSGKGYGGAEMVFTSPNAKEGKGGLFGLFFCGLGSHYRK